jgi:hypothetical protein
MKLKELRAFGLRSRSNSPSRVVAARARRAGAITTFPYCWALGTILHIGVLKGDDRAGRDIVLVNDILER